MTVAGQNDLFLILIKIVESMEQRFLRTHLIGKKLDIVYHEYVGVAVLFAESLIEFIIAYPR